ncbi:hypothetical protein J6590_032154 [Homalodisca vitripennis]|nr:hypothetical protein J6590_032154 [Homalodisca vitripennis]
MTWLWAVTALCLGICHGEQLADSDSLRGALEAINRRQRDLADPTLYYLDHFRPRVMYPRHGDVDGQPEDIGYGYQKSLAPKTAGVFDAIPAPEGELGSHSPGVETHHHPNGVDLENIILDYIEENMDNSDGIDPQRYQYENKNSDSKRSVFRERDINDLPDILQNLYFDKENSEQYYENGEHPHVVPSSFRERFSSKPSRNSPTRNAQSLVKSFGGLNRDTDNFPDNDDDPDEYLSMLNSVWEKYQDSNPETFDPEDLSETDVEEILDYLNHKEEKKRQHGGNYDMGYDFFNSPLAWVKRDRQRLSDNPKPPSDQFLHALKFLNSHTDTLESMREEDIPDEERDADVAKLLMDEQAIKNTNHHKKRFWRGNTYNEHFNNVAKRYPIAKRSSSYYTSPAVLYHKTSSNDHFNSRRKKNVKNHPADDTTDPKVARELNDIFSPSDSTKEKANQNPNSTQKSHLKPSETNNNSSNNDKPSVSNSSKTSSGEVMSDHSHNSHAHRKRSGQKEETSIDSQHKPLEMTKKSVNWSDYFGIDKRRKKSANKPGNDGWLLDQYLKAYSISARAIKDPGDNHDDKTHFEIDKKSSDDMDAKLRAMEDMIVDQALKYTGAHEGMTDSEEVQAVKDRVIAQLAAAYSLEKMRKALSEFKSSIAAQKASAPLHSTTHSPTDVPEQKDKRVAVKKEKAGSPPDGKLEKKEESDNGISVIHSSGRTHSVPWSEDESCPVMDDIAQRCKEIANMAGDTSEILSNLCYHHQICYLCSAETETSDSACDMTFLTKANNLCGDSPRCRYTARRTMATMHSLRGDPSPLGCDWRKYTCLGHYLLANMR